MRRASMTRRLDPFGSPHVRSRSEERVRKTDDDLLGDDSDRNVAKQLYAKDSDRLQMHQDASHKRSASDPLDDAGGEEMTTTTQSSVFDRSIDVIPTLPRYPMANNRDSNCFSEPGVKLFHIRGPNYLHDRKKVESEPFLLQTRGCDLLLTTKQPKNVGRNNSLLGGALRKVPTFIINFRFPWGVLVQYFEIPQNYVKFLTHSNTNENGEMMMGMTPAERTLARFFQASDKQRNNTLKLIPYVAEGPWIVRSMVTGRPVIVGNKLPIEYTFVPAVPATGQACYLEADLDIGNSTAAAKRIVSVCRRYMNDLTADIGYVLEGKEEDELPEQMLCAIRVHKVDALKAPTLPDE